MSDGTDDTEQPGSTVEPPPSGGAPPRGPLREIVQPFVDFAHASRGMWGINISYFVEGMVYFGILTLLSEYFSENVGLSEVQASMAVGALTFGITFSMALFGGLADRWGIRKALLASLAMLLVGRLILVGGNAVGLTGPMVTPFTTLVGDAYSYRQFSAPLLWVTMAGIVGVVLGYGMYQPVCYSAVRQFGTAKTAPMGYAMLYAGMNLGGWLPTFVSPPVRKAYGVAGVYWVYAKLTALTLIITMILLPRRVVESAIATAKAASPAKPGAEASGAATAAAGETPPRRFSLGRWLREHPLADPKFSFFIFCLIPVQTLFAHNWLTLPKYVERAFHGTWIGENFEAATSFNSLLIFILVPIVTALTEKSKVSVYNMMIYGTAVMALPTFFLAFRPSVLTLTSYLVAMTVGEAMWQPRFLQYATEIAPEGRAAAYVGVAQIPWFLTKLITSLYAGWFIEHYCPKGGPLHTERMWLIYSFIAISSTILLLLAKGWLGKDFKTKS